MTEKARLFAVLRQINPGNTYMTSFADEDELQAEINKKDGKIELVDSSPDYDSMLKVLEQDAPPSLMERAVEISTNSNGKFNSKSLLWFLKKIN